MALNTGFNETNALPLLCLLPLLIQGLFLGTGSEFWVYLSTQWAFIKYNIIRTRMKVKDYFKQKVLVLFGYMIHNYHTQTQGV